MTVSVTSDTSVALNARLTDAYHREAELLDDHDLNTWLESVTEDFRYEVPIPVTRDDPRAPQHSARGLLASETKDSVRLWVSRLSTALVDTAYAENPPVRTRHFVTNIRGAMRPDGAIDAKCNVLLTWSKWDHPPQFVSAERHDRFVDVDGDLRLRRRTAFLDSNVVYLGHLRVLV